MKIFCCNEEISFYWVGDGCLKARGYVEVKIFCCNEDISFCCVKDSYLKRIVSF